MPYPDLVRERFRAWLARSRRTRAASSPPSSSRGSSGIRDHVAASLGITADDFDYTPFVEARRAREGGAGLRRRPRPAARRAQRGARHVSDLPAGWVETTLGEIARPGFRLRRHQRKFLSTGAVTSRGSRPGRPSRATSRSTSSAELATSREAGYELVLDDARARQARSCISSRAAIGYVAIARSSVCTNQGFQSFIPANAVTSDYLVLVPQVRDSSDPRNGQRNDVR